MSWRWTSVSNGSRSARALEEAAAASRSPASRSNAPRSAAPPRPARAAGRAPSAPSRRRARRRGSRRGTGRPPGRAGPERARGRPGPGPRAVLDVALELVGVDVDPAAVERVGAVQEADEGRLGPGHAGPGSSRSRSAWTKYRTPCRLRGPESDHSCSAISSGKSMRWRSVTRSLRSRPVRWSATGRRATPPRCRPASARAPGSGAPGRCPSAARSAGVGRRGVPGAARPARRPRHRRRYTGRHRHPGSVRGAARREVGADLGQRRPLVQRTAQERDPAGGRARQSQDLGGDRAARAVPAERGRRAQQHARGVVVRHRRPRASGRRSRRDGPRTRARPPRRARSPTHRAPASGPPP